MNSKEEILRKNDSHGITGALVNVWRNTGKHNLHGISAGGKVNWREKIPELKFT
jgi:hypothetical protein